MKLDEKFTRRIQDWLESPAESRNLDEGAMLLLQLTGNKIQYRNIMCNPGRWARHIERELQKRLNVRLQQVTHEQVEAMAVKVEKIYNDHLSLQETNPASEFKAGKRGDHDALPAEIQSLYVENLGIVQRMRALHAELRVLTNRPGTCPDSDRYPFLKELIELDTRLHENWAKYDGYDVATGEVAVHDDARAASKKAVSLINLQKGRYRANPTEELKKKLADAYTLVVNPTEKMTAELKELGIIE